MRPRCDAGHLPECYSQQGPGQLYTALRHQHGPRLQPRAGMSARSLVVLLATDIDPDLWCCMTTGLDYGRHPDIALSSSMGQGFTMASDGKEGYSHLAVPLHPPVSSPSFFIMFKPLCFSFSCVSPPHTCTLLAALALGRPESRSLGIFPRKYFYFIKLEYLTEFLESSKS